MPMVSCDGTCKVSTNYTGTGTIIREYASKLERGQRSTAALMQARARGARIHDYWQEAA